MKPVSAAPAKNAFSVGTLKILAASHVTHGFGCAQALEKFLTQQGGDFTLITHPLYGTADFRSTVRRFEKGKPVEQTQGPRFQKLEALRYVKDALLTFIWGWKGGKRYDLFIGMNCLVATAGLWLRRWGRVKEVIYYTADYSGQRFRNSLMNKIYDRFDRYAVRQADMVWNVSRKIEERRWKQGARREKTMVVPNTVDFDYIPDGGTTPRLRRNNLVYVGGLNEGYGLEEFVELLPWVLQTFPQIEIDIIGGGALEDVIRQKAASLGLGERVHFHGYMPYEKALAFLAQSSVGFAPYAAEIGPEHYLRYCDPSKVKAYMGCGCSVIIRNVPELARTIAMEKAGWVYETKEELQRILEEIFSHPERVEEVRRNAQALAWRFDNRQVFEEAFEETFKRWGWNR